MLTTELKTLNAERMQNWIYEHVPLDDFRGKRVLMIVPDNTRTAPLPVLFPAAPKPVASCYEISGCLGRTGHASADAAGENPHDAGDFRRRSVP